MLNVIKIKRNRRRAADCAVKDTKFILRSTKPGFEACRPVPYSEYHKLRENEMYPALNGHLNRLFAGEVDDGNGDMLDSIIISASREALADLNRQRCTHAAAIRRIVARHTADREDIRQYRENCEAERNLIETSLNKINEMLSEQEEI